MTMLVTVATEADARDVAALRTAVRTDLVRRFGRRFASVTEESATRAILTSRVLVGRADGRIVATLRLDTRKPWAIDLAYFTPLPRVVYLHDLAVEPNLQRSGLGRALIEQAKSVARAWPVDGIRVGAYDAEFGAGAFYAKCGFSEMGHATYRRTPLVYFELVFPPAPRAF